jgi:hypothetical protein
MALAPSRVDDPAQQQEAPQEVGSIQGEKYVAPRLAETMSHHPQ